MTVVELEMPVDTSQLCERVRADLPDWFGFEDVNSAYVGDIAGLPKRL